MATAGEIVDIIAQRVRDPSNTAHPRATVRDVLNRVQTALNALEGYVLETLPLTTTPGQAIYVLETDLPSHVTVTEIEVSDRYLDRIPWRNLWKTSNTWLSDVGEPWVWAMIGRSLLVVYPLPRQPITINVKGPRITTLLTSDAIPLDLRDEDSDIAVDLTTAILLLRQRDIANSEIIANRAADRLGLQEASEMEEMRIEKR